MTTHQREEFLAMITIKVDTPSHYGGWVNADLLAFINT